MQVHDPVAAPLINACGIHNLLRLAGGLHVITSRQGDCDGNLFGVLPVFPVPLAAIVLLHVSECGLAMVLHSAGRVRNGTIATTSLFWS